MPVTLAAHASGGFQSTVTRVVLHDEEFLVGPNSAEIIAGFFANPATGTSAHYVVDADSVQHCVPEHTVAYHAPPNEGSIGIEHDGYAHFDAAAWDTPGSRETLARSAELTAGICRRWGIPAVFLTAADLRANPVARGITFHSQVTLAFGQSTHMDPGDHFPIDAYLAAVAAVLTPAPPAALPAQEAEVIIIRNAARAAAVLDPTPSGPLARTLSAGEWQALYRLRHAADSAGASDDDKRAAAAIAIVVRPTAEHDALTGYKPPTVVKKILAKVTRKAAA